MDLFTIIFNTSVGPIMFKTFRNGESSLEEIARHNGHEELACYLEQKHSKYVSPSHKPACIKYPTYVRGC